VCVAIDLLLFFLLFYFVINMLLDLTNCLRPIFVAIFSP